MLRLSLVRIEQAQRLAAPHGLDWLSGDERRRLDAIGAKRRRSHFLAGRWWARRQLAACGGGAWTQWQLDAPGQGRPEVTAAASPGPWFVNLSHSGGWLACVAGRHRAGVDVEQPRPSRDVAALARASLSHGEYAAFEQDDAAAQHARFYRCWTLKEAWIKQRGLSLAPAMLPRLHGEPDAFGPAQVWQAEHWTLALCMDDAAAAPRIEIDPDTTPALLQAAPSRWRVTRREPAQS